MDTRLSCEQLLGTMEPVNIFLLGACFQAGGLPVSSASIERAIEINRVEVEGNLAAFRWGRLAVADPAAFALSMHVEEPVTSSAVVSGQLLAASPLRGATRDLAEIRVPALVEWGGHSAAKRYLQIVESAWTSERGVTERTEYSEEVAKGTHRVIAYKDEYEVARLMFSPKFLADLQTQFPDAHKIRYQLHPPVLRSLGRKRKLPFSPATRPMFRVLAAARVVRGTPLDVFGYTSVRKLERGLRDQYLGMVEGLTQSLTAENYDHAVAAASAVEVVKGYESIKERNVERYRERLSELGIRY